MNHVLKVENTGFICAKLTAVNFIRITGFTHYLLYVDIFRNAITLSIPCNSRRLSEAWR